MKFVADAPVGEAARQAAVRARLKHSATLLDRKAERLFRQDMSNPSEARRSRNSTLGEREGLARQAEILERVIRDEKMNDEISFRASDVRSRLGI